MNDFSNNTNFSNTDQNNQHDGLGFTSNDLRSNSGWAIGATVAAVAAIVGIGAALTFGGGNDSSAQAAPAQPAVTAPAPVATAAPVVESAAPAASTPTVAAEPATTPTPTETVAPVVQVATPTPTETVAPAVAPKAAPVKNEGPCPTYTETTSYPLSLCSKGELVNNFQSLIHYVDPDFAMDGFFGPATEQAVKDIQSSHGVPQTGVVTEDLIELHSSLLFHDEPDNEDEIDTAWTSEPIWYGSTIYFDEAGTAVAFDQYDNQRPVLEICIDIQNWIVEIEITDGLEEMCDILDIRIVSGH